MMVECWLARDKRNRKPHVWIVERKVDSPTEWLPTTSMPGLTKAAALNERVLYQKTFPNFKFRVCKYVREEIREISPARRIKIYKPLEDK